MSCIVATQWNREPLLPLAYGSLRGILIPACYVIPMISSRGIVIPMFLEDSTEHSTLLSGELALEYPFALFLNNMGVKGVAPRAANNI